jgi:hypothetical protein
MVRKHGLLEASLGIAAIFSVSAIPAQTADFKEPVSSGGNHTRVFNLALSNAASNLRKPGIAESFHELTHIEPVDAKLGYQPEATFFMDKTMETFATFLQMMESVREGSGTLLDHSLVLATSDSNEARMHSIDSLPIMVAGTAGGKWRSGLNVAGKGDPSSRVGLTIQQVLGMPIGSWGLDAMKTSSPISEVLA